MRPIDAADRETDHTAQTERSDQTSQAGVSRRAFLGAGATILGGTLAASAPVPAAAALQGAPENRALAPADLDRIEHRDVTHVEQRVPDPHSDSERVVNGVEDLGLDPTAQDNAQGAIQRAAARGDVVELPPGDYMLNSTVTTQSSGWGIVGTGEQPEDVRLHGRGALQLIEQRGGSDVRLENFAMVNGTDGEVATDLHDGRGGPRGVGLKLLVEDGLLVRDVHHIGVSPREGNDGNHEDFDHQKASLTIQITDPDGVGLVQRFQKTSPTEVSGHAENDAVFNSWQQHRGTCYVQDSLINNAGGDGATYVARSPGNWRFVRCAFQNNYANTLRLAGAGSWAKSCTILCDSDADDVNNLLFPDVAPMNPIVWESGSSRVAPGGQSGGLVIGCRIIMRSVPRSAGAISVDGSHGGVAIVDTEIINDTDQPCIAAGTADGSFMNNHQRPDLPHALYLEGLQLTGSGSGAAILINGRPQTTGQQVCVQHPGAVTGLPDAALGCTGSDGGDPGSAAPELFPRLVTDPDATTGTGPAPDVPGVGGGLTGALAAAHRYMTMVIVVVIAGLLAAALASIATAWLVWEALSPDW